MRRIVDAVVDCTGAGLWRTSVCAHVRVWEGGEQDPTRLVVLLGSLHDGIGVEPFVEDMVGHLDRTVLHGRAREAVWCLYYPKSGIMPDHSVRNVVVRFAGHYAPTGETRPDPARPWWRRWLDWVQDRAAVGPDVQAAQWLPSSLTELEHVLGETVECYPPVAYTRETVAAFAADPDRVHEVTHDSIYSRPLLDALAFFDAVPAEHQYSAAATRACTMLADAVRERWSILDRSPWDDGTQPYSRADAWPTAFAARVVPPELTSADTVLLQRYGDPFDVGTDPEQWARLRRLLGQLRLWREDSAADADAPDEPAHVATATADNLLSVYLRAVSPEFAADDHPDFRLRRFDVVGDCDRRYLAGVDWSPGADETSARYRRLRQRFLTDEQPRVVFGTDPWQHLVAYSPGPPDETRAPASFCVEWPLRPPAEPISAACLIVADGDTGDRPVYLELPDGRLAPLPDRPDHHLSGWNFGYSGEGPGAVESAIMSLFTRTEALDPAEFPGQWLEEQVCRSPQDRLVVSVAELRARILRR